MDLQIQAKALASASGSISDFAPSNLNKIIVSLQGHGDRVLNTVLGSGNGVTKPLAADAWRFGNALRNRRTAKLVGSARPAIRSPIYPNCLCGFR
jgi:hypothetical protein